jgi:dTDP-4-dehydrorhamnose 3,5-epimerase
LRRTARRWIFVPELAAGWRWNDPVFAIDWPFAPAVISARDANCPDFTP